MLLLSALRMAVDQWGCYVNEGCIYVPLAWERYPPTDWVDERWVDIAAAWLYRSGCAYACRMSKLIGELMLFPAAADGEAAWR
ncbi:MAG: hypothetical protein ABW167_07885 [Baekduia sp.]